MFYLYLSNKHFNFQKANLAHAYQTRCIFTKKKRTTITKPCFTKKEFRFPNQN